MQSTVIVVAWIDCRHLPAYHEQVLSLILARSPSASFGPWVWGDLLGWGSQIAYGILQLCGTSRRTIYVNCTLITISLNGKTD